MTLVTGQVACRQAEAKLRLQKEISVSWQTAGIKADDCILKFWWRNFQVMPSRKLKHDRKACRMRNYQCWFPSTATWYILSLSLFLSLSLSLSLLLLLLLPTAVRPRPPSDRDRKWKQLWWEGAANEAPVIRHDTSTDQPACRKPGRRASETGRGWLPRWNPIGEGERFFFTIFRKIRIITRLATAPPFCGGEPGCEVSIRDFCCG